MARGVVGHNLRVSVRTADVGEQLHEQPEALPAEGGGRGRRWRVAVLAILVVLVGLEAGARALDERLPEPLVWHSFETQRKVEQIDALAAAEGVDVAFVGTSMVNAAVIPSVFEEAAGGDVSAYNAGLSSGIPRLIEQWTLHLVVPRLDPELVVIGVSSLDMTDAGVARTAFLDAFLDSDGGRELLDDESPLDRADRWLREHSALWEHRAELRDPGAVLDAVAGRDPDDDEVAASIDGGGFVGNLVGQAFEDRPPRDGIVGVSVWSPGRRGPRGPAPPDRWRPQALEPRPSSSDARHGRVHRLPPERRGRLRRRARVDRATGRTRRTSRSSTSRTRAITSSSPTSSTSTARARGRSRRGWPRPSPTPGCSQHRPSDASQPDAPATRSSTSAWIAAERSHPKRFERLEGALRTRRPRRRRRAAGRRARRPSPPTSPSGTSVTAVADHLGHRAVGEGDHRGTAGHGLDEREAEALVPARQHERRRTLVDGDEVLDVAEELHAVGPVGRGQQRVDLGPPPRRDATAMRSRCGSPAAASPPITANASAKPLCGPYSPT